MQAHNDQFLRAKARAMLNDYNSTCPHDGAFLFFCDNANHRFGWVCEHACGFFLDFDPDIATVNNRGDNWWEVGVAYVEATEGKHLRIDYTKGEQ